MNLETISTAITAAETGHLVFSTLHTIGAAATIDRIIDVFPPHQQQQIRVQLATVLETVVSQQLVPLKEEEWHHLRLLCEQCHKDLIEEEDTPDNRDNQTVKKNGMVTWMITS